MDIIKGKGDGSPMNTAKGKAPGIFGWIFFFVTVLPSAIAGAAAFGGLKWIAAGLKGTPGASDGAADPGGFMAQVTRFTEGFWFLGFPFILGFFLLLSILLWLISRGKVRQASVMAEVSQKKRPKVEPLEPLVDPKVEERVRGRLLLYLLTVFQRDGRLVDFLKEDLNLYEDSQIGAAVRSIHADCGKILDRQFSLMPVMEAAEESEVTIPADFDPVSIKLTGNVTGSPPFKGVLRHRGWRAGRMELPTLSGDPDPKIVAPAEVEIL